MLLFKVLLAILEGYKCLRPNYPNFNSLSRVNSLVEASSTNYYSKYYYYFIIIVKKVVTARKAIIIKTKIKTKKVKTEINTYYAIFTKIANKISSIKTHNSTINTSYSLIR